ncbi:MAG: 3-deoxy-D-manno-octulosonate 8-phosphate phosphatase [Polyangiaceae bacterium]|nr:3-deoxy-D-manno-octulosonate 8-phosphate phosphatase [Polyangiaceae bacterium]
MRGLSRAEARRRAQALRLVLTDCDGVLTDASVYYSAKGEELKRFSIRDGLGVERLRKSGVATVILSGELSPSVVLRAEKLALRTFLGVKDKAARFGEIKTELGVDDHEIAFIGDDVNDLGLIERLAPHGLIAAPADAQSEVRARAHFHCRIPGGQGAFRELAEWLLELRRPA